MKLRATFEFIAVWDGHVYYDMLCLTGFGWFRMPVVLGVEREEVDPEDILPKEY